VPEGGLEELQAMEEDDVNKSASIIQRAWRAKKTIAHPAVEDEPAWLTSAALALDDGSPERFWHILEKATPSTSDRHHALRLYREYQYREYARGKRRQLLAGSLALLLLSVGLLVGTPVVAGRNASSLAKPIKVSNTNTAHVRAPPLSQSMGNQTSRTTTSSPTPSHGNPASTNDLNTELNNVARNTDDTNKARTLVAQGADLSSTNGPVWRHTPLHQAAFHGRYQMARVLIELGAPLELHSNPCGRGEHGTPLELARGGGHHRIAQLIEAAIKIGRSREGDDHLDLSGVWYSVERSNDTPNGDRYEFHLEGDTYYIVRPPGGPKEDGHFTFDGTTVRHSEGPSATLLPNGELHWDIEGGKWLSRRDRAKPVKEAPPAPFTDVPKGFSFQSGYGEATRGDQIGHITSGGVEGHCFSGDKMNWPLHWAAMIGDVNAINRLVAHGHDANVKMTSWFDSEPLGWAASFGQIRAIEALIAAGADPHRPANLAGNTPLADAQRENHPKAIKLLEEYLSGRRPIGKPVKSVAGGDVPPLHKVVNKLRVELGIGEEMPMAQLVDRAVYELKSRLRL